MRYGIDDRHSCLDAPLIKVEIQNMVHWNIPYFVHVNRAVTINRNS